MGQNWFVEGRWFAPDGSPIETIEEFDELFRARIEDMSSDSWWRRCTCIDAEVEVSTVWLGLDHRIPVSLDDPEPPEPPLIWETMIFGGDYDQHQWRYSSRQQALDDHERIVRALRAGQDPRRPDEPVR